MVYFKGILVLMVAALLLGCPGGGTDTVPTTPADNGGAAPDAGDAVPDAGGAVPDAGGETPDDDGSGSTTVSDSTDDFETLVANSLNLEYKATYETTIISDGETLSSTSTMVLKGEKMRTDTTTEYDGEVMQSSIYLLEDGVYICSFDPETTCLFFGGSEDYETADSAGSTLTDQVADSPDNYDIFAKPSRTIAGITAPCFGFAGFDIDGEFETCYSSEGLNLYTHYSYGTDEYTMIATSVQIGSVSDSEFVLPAEPLDLEDLLGDYYGDYEVQ